jgi:hypothetical protein
MIFRRRKRKAWGPGRAWRWSRAPRELHGARCARAAILAVVFLLGLVHASLHDVRHDAFGHFAAGNDMCLAAKLPGTGPATAPELPLAPCYTESFRFVSVEALPRFSTAVGFRPRDPPPV